MKNIVIIGACGRIGSCLARSIDLKKNNLILVDNNKKKLLELKKLISPSGEGVCLFCGDLTKVLMIKKLIKYLIKTFYHIDTVVCAFYPKNKGFGKKFDKLNVNTVKETLWNQLGSVIAISQFFLKIYKKQDYGNLILLSSIQGIRAPKFWHYKKTNMTSPIEYTAIKSAIISITSYLAKYYNNSNIRVNCVSPGGIKDQQPKLFQKKYKLSSFSKGLLDAKDIIGTIQFLISEKSMYINGQNIVVDDGWSL